MRWKINFPKDANNDFVYMLGVATVTLLVLATIASAVTLMTFTAMWLSQIRYDLRYQGGPYRRLYNMVLDSSAIQVAAAVICILIPSEIILDRKLYRGEVHTNFAGRFLAFAALVIGIVDIIFVSETIYFSSAHQCALMYATRPRNLTEAQKSQFDDWCKRQTSGMTAAESDTWWSDLRYGRCDGYHQKIVATFAAECAFSVAIVPTIIAFVYLDFLFAK